MEFRMARRMDNMKASEVREALKITQQPDIISFAGGLPAPELFPVRELIEVSRMVLQESGSRALQYAPTEGYNPLRDWVAARMNQTLGTEMKRENILITHGSQQALDLAGKVFLDEGDVVLCERPTYLAAITAFRAYGCVFAEVDTDKDGMLPESLEEQLRVNDRVKLVYIIPDFQNPTGTTWSRARRKQAAEITAKYGVPLFEDNPYHELRYEGEHLPSAKVFDRTSNVLCTGTFSKIFCPGLRIGWLAGDEDLIRRVTLAKQGTDLQCNTLAQMEIVKFMECYDIDAHIERIRDVYRSRRDVAVETMSRTFPDSVQFKRPNGGLFTWGAAPANVNIRKVLSRCLDRKVAFIPGGSFYANNPQENTFRLNFSCMPEKRIREGIKIIGEELVQFLRE